MHQLDETVSRAQAAARAFRGDRRPGARRRDRLGDGRRRPEQRRRAGRLAIEETGFGVFEDKVVKNYIATEFLYDYLRDERSVGVIDEDAERAIQYVAEPIGVVLALTPITNPTSTVLFKAIVAAKTRNAIDLPPLGARGPLRGARRRDPAGRRRAAGLPPDALQVVPDPTLDVSQYLFHHPGVDFIWTTGGPKAVAAANAAGKPVPERRRRQRAGVRPPQRRRADGRRRHADLQDLRRLGDLPGRADLHHRRRRLGRAARRVRSAWARGCSTPDEVDALADASFAADGAVELAALGSRAPNLGRIAGFDVDADEGAARAAARPTSTSSPATRCARRS